MSGDADQSVVTQGPYGRVAFAETENGKMPAREFFHNLKMSERSKLEALFDRWANTGKIWNKDHFKKIDDNLFQFKTTNGTRVPCFIEGRTCYLTHGFVKKRWKIPKGQIARANKIRSEHLASRGEP
jgi:hypothetical protein